MTFESRHLDIASKGIIGSTERWSWVMASVGGTDRVAEVCNLKVAEGLGEHLSLFSSLWILTMVSAIRRPSPTSDERRVRACSTAGPTTTLE